MEVILAGDTGNIWGGGKHRTCYNAINESGWNILAHNLPSQGWNITSTCCSECFEALTFQPLNSPLEALWNTLNLTSISRCVTSLTPADYVTLEKDGSEERCTAAHEHSCRQQDQAGRARGRKRKRASSKENLSPNKKHAKHLPQLYYWLPRQPQ